MPNSRHSAVRAAVLFHIKSKAAALMEVACSLSPIGAVHSPVRVGVVLAAWDPANAIPSLDLFLRHSRRLPGSSWVIAVVANNESILRELRSRKGASLLIVPGSNQEAEFSAYEQGRQALLAHTGHAPDVWLIANDRLPAYGARELRSLNLGLLRCAANLPLASGSIHALAAPIQLWKYRLSSWISSYWLLVSAKVLARSGSLIAVSADEYARHVPASFPGSWPLTPWLGSGLSDHLRDWLTLPGGWSRATPLNETSWPMLRFKALSILNEKLLSAHLREAGATLISWRQARALSRLPAHEPFWHTFLELSRDYPDLGAGIELSTAARVQLATAVLCARTTPITSQWLTRSATELGQIALERWRQDQAGNGNRPQPALEQAETNTFSRAT